MSHKNQKTYTIDIGLLCREELFAFVSASEDALQNEIVGVADAEASDKGGLQLRESAAALEFRVMDVSCLNSVFGEGWHIQEEYMADPTGCGAKIGTVEICTLKMGKAFPFVLKLQKFPGEDVAVGWVKCSFAVLHRNTAGVVYNVV
jgi:hypothetical protein